MLDGLGELDRLREVAVVGRGEIAGTSRPSPDPSTEQESLPAHPSSVESSACLRYSIASGETLRVYTGPGDSTADPYFAGRGQASMLRWASRRTLSTT